MTFSLLKAHAAIICVILRSDLSRLTEHGALEQRDPGAAEREMLCRNVVKNTAVFINVDMDRTIYCDFQRFKMTGKTTRSTIYNAPDTTRQTPRQLTVWLAIRLLSHAPKGFSVTFRNTRESRQED